MRYVLSPPFYKWETQRHRSKFPDHTLVCSRTGIQTWFCLIPKSMFPPSVCVHYHEVSWCPVMQSLCSAGILQPGIGSLICAILPFGSNRTSLLAGLLHSSPCSTLPMPFTLSLPSPPTTSKKMKSSKQLDNDSETKPTEQGQTSTLEHVVEVQLGLRNSLKKGEEVSG